MARWIDTAAHTLGLEADALNVNYGHVGELVRSAGPALLYLDDPAEPRVVAIVGARGDEARVIALDHSTIRVSRAAVEGVLLRKVYATSGPAWTPYSRARTFRRIAERMSATSSFVSPSRRSASTRGGWCARRRRRRF